MPIYEYYCPKNHTIYQFFAKTLAQGKTIPKCPDNPKFPLRKIVSAFAISSGGPSDGSDAPKPVASSADAAEEAQMDAAMGSLEKEFAGVDDNDPRALGRMMRKMTELGGGKLNDERLDEVVRRLEEGTDPDALEETFGNGEMPEGDVDDEIMRGEGPPKEAKEPKHRYKARSVAPRRDPKLYDYD